jgi:hypothetical protein
MLVRLLQIRVKSLKACEEARWPRSFTVMSWVETPSRDAEKIYIAFPNFLFAGSFSDHFSALETIRNEQTTNARP